MKLFYSPTSPYARKVLVTALEKGLGERVEVVQCNPHAGERRLLAANPMSLAQIAVACALGYLDFRLPDVEWRRGCPKLHTWFEGFAERPSMLRTLPR